MTLRALVIHPDDNVANLIGSGVRGQQVECLLEDGQHAATVTLLDDIPANHKVARSDIRAGSPVIKYGLSIGRAVCDIRQGEHVHVHNVESTRGRGDLQPSNAPRR